MPFIAGDRPLNNPAGEAIAVGDAKAASSVPPTILYGAFWKRMTNAMKLAHINLVARDAAALAAFYMTVMNCELLRAPKLLSGEIVSRGNGLPNCEI